MKDDPDVYEKLMEDTVGQTNVLRRTLERKLAAKMKRSWVGGQQQGRLDSRRLVGAYTGSENIYKQREDSDDIDTAVIILIDHSMSMSHGRIIMAAKACVALASALENTNISYAIQGFTTNSRGMSKRNVPEGTNVDLYDSFSPLVKIRYKEFGDKLSRVKGSLGGITETFGNCAEYNVDGLSVDQSGRELLRRPEKRKVLMVLSDGQPADKYMSKCVEERTEYQSHLGSVVLSLMSDGIDVFGIGIESDAVSDYYPKYAILNNLNDLESKVISKMDDLLIGGLNVRKAS
jgi:cobaltochelatase CobT